MIPGAAEMGHPVGPGGDDPQAPAARGSSGIFLRHALLAFCLFLILAAVETYPLILRLGTHVCCDVLDPTMLTWVLAWDVHALTKGDPRHLFDANIFYPVERSLAFSEHMLGVAPIFAPGYLLTRNPIVGYNVVLLLSFALSGLGMFCLAYHWTRQFWPSLVAGTLFGFAPYRFGQLSHLQLQNFFWAPFALLFLDRFLGTQRWRDLAGFAGFYWFQVLSSLYLGYMVSVGVILFAVYALVVDRGLWRLSLVLKVLAFASASVAVLVPSHLPYLEVQERWGFGRGIREIMHYTPDVLSYLSAPPFMNDAYLSVFRPIAPAAFWEKWLFPGLVLPALVVLGGTGTAATPWRARERRVRHVLWLMLAAALVLSLGPYLVAFGVQTRMPLPYLALHRVVPGFAAMRVPGRFVLLVLLAASPLAALGAVRCSAAVSRLRPSCSRFVPALTATGLVGLFLFELGWKPFPLVAVPGDQQTRALYRWLSTERPGPIVELPFGFEEDYRYVYFTTAHWLPLVNGLSSFAPATYDEIQSALNELPAPKAVAYAGALGIEAIVVHQGDLSWEDLGRWSDEATARSGLKKIASFGPHVVYAVPHVSVSPSLKVETTAPPWGPARKRVRLGLIVEPGGRRPWRHPGPHGRSRGVVQWADSRTGRFESSTVRFRLPPVIPAGTPFDVPFDSRFPETPGVYTLRVSIPALGIASDARVVEVRNATLPTSADSPRLLAAAYSSRPVDEPVVVTSREPIHLEIGATNLGPAIWLARADHGRGVVKLGWRWFGDGHEFAELSGRTPILHDVFPGQESRFAVSIAAPPRPGRYTVQLGLVSELVAWFADVGSPPVTLPVEVRNAPEHAFATVVERFRSPETGAPQLTLEADGIRHRAGEPADLTIRCRTEQHPWIVDAYLVLEGPDGALWFHDGGRLVANERNRRTLLARSVELPAGARSAAVLRVALTGVAPGDYTWYLLVTERGTRRIIADARARMEVVP